MQYSALTGLRVLELDGGIAGSYCAKLLAGVGADVVMVEGEGMERLRTLPPLSDVDGSSLAFAYLGAGKRSIAADTPALEDLIRRSHVVITDRSSPDVPPPDHCAAINPQLVYVDISPYGRVGPHSGLPDHELLVDAVGGWLYGIGSPEREPVKPPGWQSSILSGTVAASATLGATIAAQRSGTGEHVELSRQAAVAWILMNPTTVYSYSGTIWRRDGGESPSNYPQGLMQCIDGVIGVNVMYFAEWDRLCALLDQPQWRADPRLATPLLRLQNRKIIDDILQPWLACRTVRQAYEEAQAAKLPFSPVNDPAGLLDSPQLAARAYWDEGEVGGTSLPMPGIPFRMADVPRQQFVSAPAPHEAATVIDDWAGGTGGLLAHSATAGPTDLPLRGVTVIDLTMAWAGPLATRVLRELGAEIIKIEAPSHLDRWRGGTSPQRGVERYPDGDPGDRPWNRNAFFNSQNAGKRSVALDLKTARGKELLLALVQHGGVLVENFGSGAMGRLGLDYEQLRAVRPDLVMVSMPAFGRTGPEKDYIAHGPTIEAAAGNVSLQGYEGDGPLPSGAFAWGDPVAGVNGAFAILAALTYRAISGCGTHVDLSHLESGIPFNFQAIMDYVGNGMLQRPCGSRDPLVHFQAVLPCAGDDRWVAMVAESPQALAGAVQATHHGAVHDGHDPEHHHDRRVPTDRGSHPDWVRAVLAAWTAERRVADVTTYLTALPGVTCVPVHDAAALTDDVGLKERGFFRTITHPEAGRHQYTAMPWRLTQRAWANEEPAPCFGADTVEVLTSVLDISPAEIDDLFASGVTASQPVSQGD